MDSKQFLQILKQIRTKLLFRHVWKTMQLLFFYSGVLALCIVTMASIIPIPYWERILWIGILLLFICGGAVSYRSRSTMMDSAIFFDRFIEDNLVTAALSSLHSGNALTPLVIRDALVKMKHILPGIKKHRERVVHPGVMLITAGLVLLSLLIFNQREETFQEAKRLEDEKDIIEQSNKRIAKKAREKDNAAIKERLLEEKDNLKKTKVAAERYEEITKKVKEMELLKKRMEKQNAKLQELEKELKGLNIPKIKEATQEKDAKKLQKGLNQLSEQQKDQLMKALKNHDIASVEELEELLKAAKGSEQLIQLAKLQEELQEEADTLGKAIGEKDSSDSVATTHNQTSDQNGVDSQAASGSNSNESKKSTSSNKGSGGSGPKNSSGQNGSGSGAGSGKGTGNGSYPGDGNGAGSGQGSREMLSVPEKIGGKDQIELDSGKMGEGKRGDQFQSEGPVQKGSLRPYEEVYQDYYSSYRNGSDRTAIPKDLEQIIESYFSEIDPGE